MVVIVWNKRRKLRFAQLYEHAVQTGEDTFVFDRHVVVTSYAKYLLQYLNEKMPEVAPDGDEHESA